MPKENYFEIRKQELNQEAQIKKDRVLDDILRLVQQFMADWTGLQNKMAESDKQQQELDKLNPPSQDKPNPNDE